MDKEIAKIAFNHALNTYEQVFGEFFLAKFFGLGITYDTDTCTVEMPVDDFKFNPQGSLHGGVIAFMMDISMGHLLNHHVGPGATLNMNVQYLKAIRTGRGKAIGRFTRKGRKICFLRSDLFDDSGAIIAFATSTWKIIDQKEAPRAPN